MVRRAFVATALIVASAAGAAVACSSFAGDESAPLTETDGATLPVDGAVVDGDAVPGVDASEAGENLLDNADFELGCAGWQGGGNGADLTESTNSHTGTRSCLVCGRDGGAFDIAQLVPRITLAPGQQYGAEAYARAPDGGPIAKSIEAAFIVYDVGTNQQHRAPTPGVPLTGSWQHLTAIATVNDGGQRLEFNVASSDLSGHGCVLVDTARVFRLK